MPCCHYSRRQLLRWSGIAAGTSLLPILDPERSYGATRASRSRLALSTTVLAINLELVTLTETSAIVTWYTAQPPAATAPGSSLQASPLPTASNTVAFGTSPLTMTTVVPGQSNTAYHYVELTGLQPSTTYFYTAMSDGQMALPSTFSAGNPAGTAVASAGNATAFSFTTPAPPKGTYLFTLVLCNDLHLGETVAGLITSQGGQQLPPGFTTPPGEPPYAETMAAALVADSRARGGNVLIAAGDVSSGADPAELAKAKQILDGFGRYGTDYLVARGNHDRAMTGTACTPSKFAGGLDDCFHDAFFPGSTNDDPTWSSQDVGGLHIVRIDTYDKTGNGGDNGIMGAEQFAWFQADIAAHANQPTIVFGHHPVSQESSVSTAEPVIFDLDPQQSIAVQQAYAAAPGVFYHHSGHTHRNKRTTGTVATNVVFQEVAAVKEYPGGFSLLRLYTGGYAMNFYKTRSDLAREWSERTRQEDFTVGPFYVFGDVGDRNYVVDHDLSGLTPLAGSTPAALPELRLPALLPVTGLAAAGAALALAHHRRNAATPGS